MHQKKTRKTVAYTQHRKYHRPDVQTVGALYPASCVRCRDQLSLSPQNSIHCPNCEVSE